jgi:hypothetical protein
MSGVAIADLSNGGITMSKHFNSLATLMLIGLMVAAPWRGVTAGPYERDDHDGGRGRCSLAGVYIGAIPGQTTFILSAIPLDVRAKGIGLIVDTTGDGDPTGGGLFPSAAGQSNPRGFATPEGRNSYAGQLVRYIYDETRAVVGTEVQVVDIEQTDCKTLAVSIVARLFYFDFVNPGDAQLPTPDIYVDGSGFPPTEAKRMLPYSVNAPDV